MVLLPRLLLWHHFSLRAYLPGLPMRWRLLLGLFPLNVVARPSNDASVGLQGWRSGLLRRLDLCFPVLNVFDTPGQREAGFVEWPLFDIFKVDLQGLTSWADYLATLGRMERRKVRQRTKLFASFIADGRLQLQAVQLGPAVFVSVPAPAGSGTTPPTATAAREAAPPLPVPVVPASVAEAEALLARLWSLYERTGARNGFVECDRATFERLVREAPGMQAILVREGGGTALDSIIAFGLTLPQRDSLQLLYSGLEYDNPLVRQSNCYFQIMFTAIQLALEHNRQRSEKAGHRDSGELAAAMKAEGRGCTAGGSSSMCRIGDGTCNTGIDSYGAPAAKPGAADGGMALAAAGTPPPPRHAAVGLIAWLDLGPGHRFVKEHVGAMGHPLSLYTRSSNPIFQLLSKRLLSRYFSAAALVKDP
ncbi:hypothetical protein TSOC_006603 [Tetrabaena socialis]|uniref:Uncharacterized protein n=1 Tax=Tetrabaena socialis TaxID=47790 RepID=A0A2J8A3B5_9CHLO|nr:hypothetical protein TSOC_006603 [Tetrabaena socialis]|eukprot:PNH06988.1 hypothetical protein TSOC_006603 [Tetrabaena socialis]